MNIWKSHIHHFHLDHNAPHLLLNILHSHCFQFFMGITVVPREIKDTVMQNFGGWTRFIMVYVRMVNW